MQIKWRSRLWNSRDAKSRRSLRQAEAGQNRTKTGRNPQNRRISHPHGARRTEKNHRRHRLLLLILPPHASRQTKTTRKLLSFFYLQKKFRSRLGTPLFFPSYYYKRTERTDMIKKIIHTFLHNPMPEQVQQQFRTWCLNKERAGEKTDALWKEWERLDPASVLPADEKAYRRKLDRLSLR